MRLRVPVPARRATPGALGAAAPRRRCRRHAIPRAPHPGARVARRARARGRVPRTADPSRPGASVQATEPNHPTDLRSNHRPDSFQGSNHHVTQSFRHRGGSVRIAAWHGRADVASLALRGRGALAPATVDRLLDRVRAAGYREVVTNALAPAATLPSSTPDSRCVSGCVSSCTISNTFPTHPAAPAGPGGAIARSAGNRPRRLRRLLGAR